MFFIINRSHIFFAAASTGQTMIYLFTIQDWRYNNDRRSVNQIAFSNWAIMLY